MATSDKKMSQLTAIISLADGDKLLVNDVSGTAAENKNKVITHGNYRGQAVFNANKIQSVDVSATSPTAGDLLAYSGTAGKYVPNSNYYTISEVDAISTLKANKASNLADLANTGTARTNIGVDVAYWNAAKIQDITVSGTAPVAGDLLAYNGTTSKYAPNSNYYTVSEVDAISTLKSNKASNLADLSSTSSARTTMGADNAYWNANELQSVSIAATAPTAGEILKYTSGKWQAMADLGSTGAVWGNITGTLSNQTDLNTELGAKAVKANNLADLVSTSTARTNIGVANAYWNANKIQGIDVESTAPASGEILRYDATASKYETKDLKDEFYTETEIDTISTAKSNKASNLADLSSTSTARTNIGASVAYWNANKLQDVDIAATAPTAGEILKYTSGKWQAQADLGSTGAIWGNITGTLSNQTDVYNTFVNYIKRDGSVTMAANWDVGDGRTISLDGVSGRSDGDDLTISTPDGTTCGDLIFNAGKITSGSNAAANIEMVAGQHTLENSGYTLISSGYVSMASHASSLKLYGETSAGDSGNIDLFAGENGGRLRIKGGLDYYGGDQTLGSIFMYTDETNNFSGDISIFTGKSVYETSGGILIRVGDTNSGTPTPTKGQITLDATADKVLMTNHPGGSVDLAVATVKYVKDSVTAEDFWDRSGTAISPKNANDNVVPNTTGDLGLSGNRWSNVWANLVTATTVTDGTMSISGGTITGASINADQISDGTLDIGANTITVNSIEIVGSDGEVNKAAVEDSGNWDSAYTHVSNNGTDHSYIDQSVTSTASPAFTKVTTTEIEYSGNITIDAVNAAAHSEIDITNSDGTYNAALKVNGTEIVGSDSVVNKAAVEDSTNWDTAYGWGDHSTGGYLKADASVILTSDWDIGDGRKISGDKIAARDGAGLYLADDGDANYIFVKDTSGVGINIATPSSALHVYDTSTSDPRGLQIQQDNAGIQAPLLQFFKTRGGSTANDNDYCGSIQWDFLNDAGTPQRVNGAKIRATIRDITDNTEDCGLDIFNLVDGVSKVSINFTNGETRIMNSAENTTQVLAQKINLALDFWNDAGTPAKVSAGRFEAEVTDVTSGSESATVRLYHRNAGSITSTIIMKGGKVGILDDTPSYELDINGDFQVQGTTIMMPNMKTGNDQGGAGAAAGELWADTNDDNTVKLGV